ncbi:MAG: UDP-glucose/GDP-mannose dehydrogenase family protein [Armatimonadota bacterium]|nr:UDP-glucose/GDP-mannose dehydrogenase family protein [Armatimonadota bacterium]MDR7404948.1 UDP-glucose/GDP-mannose dehydrogenase family protein [Armatimonadota bacterium]
MKSAIRNPQSEIKISVIGLGHVGLPTALGLADLGWQVTGADDDRDKAARIARGEMPFHEPRADELLRRALASGRFAVAETVEAAVRESTVVFVCVGTPQRDDGSADLFQVEAVARAIARSLNGKKLIVEKSTTPVRTAERIRQTISRYRNGDHAFEVAVNPEFLREGTAVHDFFHPDRIVLGVESPWGRDLLLQVYRPLLERLRRGETESEAGDPVEDRVIVTTLATAELIKHASNAFLATKISFINMIADLCEASGADVTEVARGLGLDPRIGPAFLRAGVGFGGYCLPKDLRALIRIGEDLGVDVGLLRAVDAVNRQRVDRLVRRLERALWILRGKTVGILGLAFKPDTDDVREAPSLRVVARLREEGVALRLHDPQARESMRRVVPEDPPRLLYCDSAYDAARGAHALVVLTEWEEYRELDLSRLAALMETPVLVDGRNLFDPAAARRAGFEYYGTGR